MALIIILTCLMPRIRWRTAIFFLMNLIGRVIHLANRMGLVADSMRAGEE